MQFVGIASRCRLYRVVFTLWQMCGWVSGVGAGVECIFAAAIAGQTQEKNKNVRYKCNWNIFSPIRYE